MRVAFCLQDGSFATPARQTHNPLIINGLADLGAEGRVEPGAGRLISSLLALKFSQPDKIMLGYAVVVQRVKGPDSGWLRNCLQGIDARRA